MLSIIVPIYNSEKYLDTCLSSLVNQTYKEIEIILVDDGSTDSSYTICKKYATLDTRIKLFRKKNGGPSTAKNLGLKNATGEFITFVDSDDEVTPNTYEVNLAFFEQTPSLNVVQFPCTIHYNSPSQIDFKPSNQTILGTTKIVQHWLVKKDINWIVCNKIFKRDLLNNKFFPEKMLFEDNYLLADIITKIQNIHISDKGKYLYYHRPNSITNSSHSKEKEIALKKVNLRILKTLSDTNSSLFLKTLFINKLLNNDISLIKNFEHTDISEYYLKELNKISTTKIINTKLPKKERIKLILTKLFGVKHIMKLYKKN